MKLSLPYVCVLSMAGLAAPTLASAHHPAEVDQTFTSPTDLGGSLNEGFRYTGQTYEAGKTGWLVAVSVDIQGTSNSPARIAIHQAKDGLPSRAIWSVSGVSSGLAAISQVIHIWPPLLQVAGHEYAIVVDYPQAPPHGPTAGQGTWAGATGDLYPSGQLVESNDGLSWTPGLGADLHFVTYVKTP
jgi:hypothetical protein